ncbi:MAG TPA: DUF1843 domain-containing protein [Pyrinomonadaceae bacterium]|nr:DUF1843 domain-containing protein [Pyrinomonadaceae bacterium]
MATRKSQPQTGGAARKSAGSAATRTGALPPYGQGIRDAIARGDAGEMKRVATSARKYVKDVQAALDKLDQALGSARK